MKLLRLFLVLMGCTLLVWGLIDFFLPAEVDVKQGIAKIVLGGLGLLASVFAKNRRAS